MFAPGERRDAHEAGEVRRSPLGLCPGRPFGGAGRTTAAGWKNSAGRRIRVLERLEPPETSGYS